MHVAFVLPYGEPSDGFFADTLLALLCADARARGHRAEMVRVYYDGKSPERDRQVRARLTRWLAERKSDLVVVERLFDAAPLEEHRRTFPSSRTVQVTRGDSVEPGAGVDFVLGALPGATRRGTTKRSPAIGELRAAFGALLDVAPELDARWADVPGLSRAEPTILKPGRPLSIDVPALQFAPVLEHDVIALDTAPRVVKKTVFGNVGCPYARDPLGSEHFRGVHLPVDQELARLGCAFCHMGGDYEVRPDEDVVASLLVQARYFAEHMPELEEIVISDQHPIRYLSALMRDARDVRPLRWLFPARADTMVREEGELSAAIQSAAEHGHVLEVYLSGFEAFCDRELARYNKGTTRAEMLRSVALLRRLKARHPGAFDYARSRGHSLVLFNPWTEPGDLRESVETMREHGLGELFFEVGRNRLRLYADLPITYAAERDGALSREWQDGDEGAGRRKGYSSERPWRFLDAKTRAIYAASRMLRDTLGTETELAQLAAAIEWAEAGHDDVVDVAQKLARLEGVFGALLVEDTRPPELPRGSFVPAQAVLCGGVCNNGCAACPHRDAYLDDATILDRVDAVRQCGAVVLFAGREPTLHPSFVEAVARAGGKAGVVSNGRRFAYTAFTQAAARAGLASASIKLFGTTAAIADDITRDPGGFDQALAGISALARAGAALELRVPLYRANLPALEHFADLALQRKVPSLRIELALDAVGLEALGRAADAVERLVRRCCTLGVALEASPLRAGMRDFRFAPAQLSGERSTRTRLSRA